MGTLRRSDTCPTGALVGMHSDVLTCTAGEIAARVRGGTTTAVEVARAHLARIGARDPELGAFEAVDAERMLAEAAAVDGRPDRFALPLAGVPIAVKDNVRVAGPSHPPRLGRHLDRAGAGATTSWSSGSGGPARWSSARRACPSWRCGVSRSRRWG